MTTDDVCDILDRLDYPEAREYVRQLARDAAKYRRAYKRLACNASKGGKARAAGMSAKKRSEQARHAANARWGNP